MSVYEGIMQGLQEAVDYNKGNIKARSTKINIMPLTEFKASEIKNIRNDLGMTQFLFAGFMGVSQKTVEAWEAGRNVPNGPAKRMLAMVKVDPTIPERFNIIEK